MNIKHTLKQIRCRLSREYCYGEMSRSGHALMLFCEGKGVDIGDNGMKCVPNLNRLNAYGYDVHGTGSNGLIAHIKFCPMCGRKLV